MLTNLLYLFPVSRFPVLLVVIQSLSCVWLFVTPWTAALQASLSSTISQSLLKLTSTEAVMPSNHLVLCCPLSSCPQSFSASRSFPMSWLLVSGGQNIGASASVLPMNIRGWFPLVVVIVFVAQSCLTLCDPMDCGPLVSSVHGILQAKILEWIAIAFSRGSFDPGIEPGSPPLQADSYHLSYREEDPLGFPLKKKWSEVKSLSHVRLFATPWTIACQASPSMGFSRQEYWSGLQDYPIAFCHLPYSFKSFTNLLCNSSRSHLLVCTFLNL